MKPGKMLFKNPLKLLWSSQTQNKTSFHPCFFGYPIFKCKKKTQFTKLPQPRHPQMFLHLASEGSPSTKSAKSSGVHLESAWPRDRWGGGGSRPRKTWGWSRRVPWCGINHENQKKQVVIKITTCLKTHRFGKSISKKQMWGIKTI